MAEYDYNLPYEGEEIEERLKYGILASRPMNLTESQKAQARINIGAGTSSSGLQIRGYFDTYDELKNTVKNPSAGETYAVGTEAPYSIYIWDVLHGIWVDNGYIRGADGTNGTDAEVTTENIISALGYTPANKDALYSPIYWAGTDSFELSAEDAAGKTVIASSSLADKSVLITLSRENARNFPLASELAILWMYGNSVKIRFSDGIYVGLPGEKSFLLNPTISITERFGMAALKRIAYTADYDYWITTGNMEVSA